MANAPEIKQGFMTPDGVVHGTKSEAMEHLRKPQIVAALNKITNDNELTGWLLEKREQVETIFESTKIRRVTKSERKQLDKALAAIAAAGDKAFAFVIDNKDAIADSFRWPSVKRGTEEEQAATIKAGFLALTENGAALSDWIIANKDQILEAYQAGVVKREVNEKAQSALAAYRAQQAAKKAATEDAAPAAQ